MSPSFVTTLFFLFSISTSLNSSTAQTNYGNPFLDFFSNKNIGRFTQMASAIVSSVAKHSAAANVDALTRPGRPEPRSVSLTSQPSEMIGQSVTNVISPVLAKITEVSAIENRDLMSREQQQRSSDQMSSGAKSLMDIAKAFLGSSVPGESATALTRNTEYMKDANIDWLPTIREFAPGSDSNFGIPKGEGCLPFLSEFMKAAYGNCVKVADEKAWDLWGSQITNALFGGKVDFIGATKETCKRGAERQHCGQLRRVISECDILGSLQVGMAMQRAIQRCDEFSGIIDQNPIQVLNQVNGIVGGEFAQGFLHKFLG